MRTKLPGPVEDRLFDECRSRCCMCAFLKDDWEEKRVQIAHIDRNPRNNAYSNLVFLCHTHHDEYDAVRRQSKGISPRFLRKLKKRLIDRLETSQSKPRPSIPSLPVLLQYPGLRRFPLEDLMYICFLDKYCERSLEKTRSESLEATPARVSNRPEFTSTNTAFGGAWGRSLAASCGAFGHPEDPDSISVTYWMLIGFASLFPSAEVEEITQFKEYLRKRTKPNGAVGMRRNIGSPIGSVYEIIENRRHTAVAAAFLATHGGALNKAINSIMYVIQSVTLDGAWSAVGEVSDGNADPLTTAYVIRTLQDFETLGLLERLDFDGRAQFLSTYRHRAFLWLYSFLKENSGWWPYKKRGEAWFEDVDRRIYVNTADVLASIPEFPAAGADLAKEHSRLMNELGMLWRKNGLGIPAGFRDNKVHLTATALFTLACWRVRDLYPDLCREFVPKFFKNLEAILESGESDAASWAVSLRLIAATPEGMATPRSAIDNARSLAKQTWDFYKSKAKTKVRQILARKAKWVQPIATRAILPVALEPP